MSVDDLLYVLDYVYRLFGQVDEGFETTGAGQIPEEVPPEWDLDMHERSRLGRLWLFRRAAHVVTEIVDSRVDLASLMGARVAQGERVYGPSEFLAPDLLRFSRSGSLDPPFTAVLMKLARMAAVHGAAREIELLASVARPNLTAESARLLMERVGLNVAYIANHMPLILVTLDSPTVAFLSHLKEVVRHSYVGEMKRVLAAPHGRSADEVVLIDPGCAVNDALLELILAWVAATEGMDSKDLTAASSKYRSLLSLRRIEREQTVYASRELSDFCFGTLDSLAYPASVPEAEAVARMYAMQKLGTRQMGGAACAYGFAILDRAAMLLAIRIPSVAFSPNVLGFVRAPLARAMQVNGLMTWLTWSSALGPGSGFFLGSNYGVADSRLRELHETEAGRRRVERLRQELTRMAVVGTTSAAVTLLIDSAFPDVHDAVRNSIETMVAFIVLERLSKRRRLR